MWNQRTKIVILSDTHANEEITDCGAIAKALMSPAIAGPRRSTPAHHQRIGDVGCSDRKACNQ